MLYTSKVHTASYYDPQDWVGQCYRVSRAHPRGRRAQWELAPSLYPDRGLLNSYRAGTVDCAALTIEYRRGLDASLEQDGRFRDWVEGLASAGDLTLLCFERGEKLCHRRVAAQWLLDRAPGLVRGYLR